MSCGGVEGGGGVCCVGGCCGVCGGEYCGWCEGYGLVVDGEYLWLGWRLVFLFGVVVD